MAPLPTGPARLRVGDACREGWIAFGQAPWPFLLFSLLGSLAMGACGVVGALGVVALLRATEAPDNPAALLVHLLLMLASLGAVLVGLLGLGLVALVTTLGFCRGAWLALEGQRPRFADLIRWDGAAINRLVLAWTAQQLVLLLPLGLAALAWFGLQDPGLARPLALAIGLVAGALVGWALLWFAVNQCFLNPLCLFREQPPLGAVLSGIRGVRGQWWPVAGLQGLLLAGMAVAACASANGLAIAFTPVLCCINMAAYRQLFGTEDRLGLATPRRLGRPGDPGAQP